MFFGKKKASQPAVGKVKSAGGSKDNKLSSLQITFMKLLFGRKAKTKLYAKLARFIENGVPLIRALETVSAHMSDDGKKPKRNNVLIVNDIINEIRNGKTFSQALRRWAKPDEVSLLNAGEISGNLHLAIADLLFLYKSQSAIKSALASLLYPIVLVGTVCFFLNIFSTQVVPAFTQVLPREQWTGKGRLLGLVGDWVIAYMDITIYSVLGLLFLIIYTLPYWTGKLRRKFDPIVPWSTYRTIKGSAFLISFAALTKAGIPSPEVISIMSRYATPWYQEILRACRRQLLNGSPNIGEALYDCKMNFPDKSTIIDMRSYAALSGAETMLEILSRESLETTVKSIQSQMAVIKNLAIFLLASTFGFIISAIFDLQMQITDAAAHG